jgi:ABC-type maltose transport system permease subunit
VIFGREEGNLEVEEVEQIMAVSVYCQTFTVFCCTIEAGALCRLKLLGKQ